MADNARRTCTALGAVQVLGVFGGSGLRAESLAEQLERGIHASRLYDEVAYLDRQKHGLWLVSAGQEDASAEQADGGDQLGEVGPRF